MSYSVAFFIRRTYNMKPTSHYRPFVTRLLAKKDAKTGVIQVRDYKELTPIPTSVHVKAPAVALLTKKTCATFSYPVDSVLNTDFAHLGKSYKKIFACIYRVSHCLNRGNVLMPFLEYLLYKYPESNSSTSDLLVFPFVKAAKARPVEEQANELVKDITSRALQPRGYIERGGSDVFIFYNLSNTELDGVPKVKLINRKNELWWCLIDEICNWKTVINYPVHRSVFSLFYNNPPLLYLQRDGNRVEIPQVAYYGSYYKFIPIAATLGELKQDAGAQFGPYLYFGTFRRSVRYAGWTPNYQPRVVYGKRIADKEGRYVQGGLARFALFLGKTKVLLDHPNDSLDFNLKKNTAWTKDFQSLYVGRIKLGNTHLFATDPEYVVKRYDGQVPLSIHLLDMASLKRTWDPDYTGYQIE